MKANYSRFLAVDKTLTPLKEHYKGFAIIDHPTVLQVFYQYHLRLKWEHLFLFLATYCLFSCWRHIHKQYLTMAFPRPEQVVVDVESVVRDYLRPATAHSPPGDLPPKYEEVQAAAAAQVTEEEAPPPQYDESMTMGSNLARNSNNTSPASSTPAVPMPTSTVQ